MRSPSSGTPGSNSPDSFQGQSPQSHSSKFPNRPAAAAPSFSTRLPSDSTDGPRRSSLDSRFIRPPGYRYDIDDENPMDYHQLRLCVKRKRKQCLIILAIASACALTIFALSLNTWAVWKALAYILQLVAVIGFGYATYKKYGDAVALSWCAFMFAVLQLPIIAVDFLTLIRLLSHPPDLGCQGHMSADFVRDGVNHSCVVWVVTTFVVIALELVLFAIYIAAFTHAANLARLKLELAKRLAQSPVQSVGEREPLYKDYFTKNPVLQTVEEKDVVATI